MGRVRARARGLRAGRHGARMPRWVQQRRWQNGSRTEGDSRVASRGFGGLAQLDGLPGALARTGLLVQGGPEVGSGRAIVVSNESGAGEAPVATARRRAKVPSRLSADLRRSRG